MVRRNQYNTHRRRYPQFNKNTHKWIVKRMQLFLASGSSTSTCMLLDSPWLLTTRPSHKFFHLQKDSHYFLHFECSIRLYFWNHSHTTSNIARRSNMRTQMHFHVYQLHLHIRRPRRSISSSWIRSGHYQFRPKTLAKQQETNEMWKRSSLGLPMGELWTPKTVLGSNRTNLAYMAHVWCVASESTSPKYYANGF